MKKKVLIIGTGSIAKRHIENILKLKQKIDLSIFSNNESRAKVFIRKLKSKKIYIVKKKYINKIKFSHVIIASKTIEHNKYINFFFKNCENIYCEKPLPIDKYTKLLMSLSKKRKINEKIKIGYQFRFNPAIQYLKKELKKKENKNTYLIKFSCGQNLKDWRNKLNYKKLHSAGNNYYGSVNWELSHELDILQFIFDKPNKIFSKFTKTNYLKINTTDLSTTTLKFKNKKTNCVVALEMLSPVLYRKLIVVSLNNYYEIDLDFVISPVP